MGMERYEEFAKNAKSTLVYTPGRSRDNLTGAWRSMRPVMDSDRCNQCGICWMYCPEGCISHGDIVIDYDYCKGCGICAVECKRGALNMEREPE